MKYIIIIILIFFFSGCSMKNNLSINEDNKTFTIKDKYIKYSEDMEYPLFLINDNYIVGASVLFNNLVNSNVTIKTLFIENKEGEHKLIDNKVLTCLNELVSGDIVFIKKDIYLHIDNICVKLKE